MATFEELQALLVSQNQLAHMICGGQLSQMLYTAAHLGIPDLLVCGEQCFEALAKTTHTNAQALLRLLKALTYFNVFSEPQPGTFALTPLSRLLLSNTEHSLRPFVLNACAPAYWSVHGALLYSIQTGQPAFDHIHRTSYFAFLEKNPEQRAVFDAQMTITAHMAAPAILATYDFSKTKQIVDIGGGEGIVIAGILQQYPLLQGILFELPEVLSRAYRYLASAELLGRCALASGDFFHSTLPVGDLYLMKQVLHDWNDEQVHCLLSQCRQYTPQNAKWLIIEYLTDDIEQGAAALSDISMLTLTGGKERSSEEYRLLFNDAGFMLNRILRLTTGQSILEAIPV